MKDFKRFNSGWAGMNNSSSSGCTSEAKQQILNEKRSYLAELKNKVNQKLGISTSTQTASSNVPISVTDIAICAKATINEYTSRGTKKIWNTEGRSISSISSISYLSRIYLASISRLSRVYLARFSDFQFFFHAEK